MRVLQIDVNCKSGSTGKIAYDLHTQLIKDGHISAVCYGRGEKINEPNIYKFGYDLETKIHAGLTRMTGLTGCYSYFSTKRLLKFMRAFRPDVVHIHELHAYFVNLKPVIRYLKEKKIKTIWTFHCEFMYTGKCGYAYECENWKTECGKCPHLKDYPKSFFFDFTKKMFRDKKNLLSDFENLTIITPSQWLADRAKQSFLGDKGIQVIHNGVDTENVFYPRNFEHLKKRHHLTDEKIILAVAPDLMSERKGGRYVVELAEMMKGENVKFILIGVEDLSEKFPDNVIALGRTDNQIELAEYYSMADVFVICSERENFPTTCVEAICCGTPVCGFDVGGTKETTPVNFGLFVNYGDLNNLKIKTIKGINVVNNRAKYFEFERLNYSRKNMYLKYKDFYTKNN
ncbi:glycosyltransferase [Eubacterium sp. AM05-23]|uniref:glycosyltransferase n=1 Tax=Eubacterium TaxID=1730 RepID=UPI000E4C4EC9|nr:MULTISPECIES: glycosyltransferase [Eubacterium]RHO57307.1 glycosyltransferase [Eubacterium sp. AM05-23]